MNLSDVQVTQRLKMQADSSTRSVSRLPSQPAHAPAGGRLRWLPSTPPRPRPRMIMSASGERHQQLAQPLYRKILTRSEQCLE